MQHKEQKKDQTPQNNQHTPHNKQNSAIKGLRRALYRIGILRSTRVAVPVIVVGNLTDGGTGKTPLVISLAETLKRAGKRPGVVFRGYVGAASALLHQERSDSDPWQVCDEPVRFARLA